MTKFGSVFLLPAYRRVLSLLAFTLVFAALLATAGWIAVQFASDTMEEKAEEVLSHFLRLRANLVSTLDVMHDVVTAKPCSPAFAEQLRYVAYLPDGFNEFLYAPGGRALCSTRGEIWQRDVDLGPPDYISKGSRGIKLWVDKELDFLGLIGERGTIALNDPFAAVVPEQPVDLSMPEWLSAEVVIVADSGTWHRSGSPGVYERLAG